MSKPGRMPAAPRSSHVASHLAADGEASHWEEHQPALFLGHSRQAWDGVIYEADRQCLFLPSIVPPPEGSELTLQIWRVDGSRFESKVRVVAVFAPGQRGAGAPAGFTLELSDPAPAFLAIVKELTASDSTPRRLAPRYRLEAPVLVVPLETPGTPVAHLEYATDGELAADYLSNLSQGGAYVRSPKPLPVGTPLRLAIQLPDGTKLETPARVVRTDPAGMGVHFELDERGEKELGAVIARIATRQRRALVVDDDALARRVIADALVERGFEVFAAADGLSGIRVLTDELLSLDLVVADVRMPTMDGEAFLNLIRGAGGEQDLAIVLITATLDAALEARLQSEGADAVLDKALGPELIAKAADTTQQRKGATVSGRVS